MCFNVSASLSNSVIFCFFFKMLIFVVLLRLFYKIGALKNFTKFTRINLCRSLFFNKLPGLRAANLFKRNSGTVIFLWILGNFWEPFFRRTTPGNWFCVVLGLLLYCIRGKVTREERIALMFNFWITLFFSLFQFIFSMKNYYKIRKIRKVGP